MPLHIGPDAPDAVHIGADLADKVMSGGVQVWPEPSPTDPMGPSTWAWIGYTTTVPVAGQASLRASNDQHRIHPIDDQGRDWTPELDAIVTGFAQGTRYRLHADDQTGNTTSVVPTSIVWGSGIFRCTAVDYPGGWPNGTTHILRITVEP